jgi:hypothetical protein
MIGFLVFLGVAILITLVNLIVFISGLSSKKTNVGQLMIFILISIALPHALGVIVNTRMGNLDLALYVMMYAAIGVQLVSIVFLYRQFNKSKE